MLCDACQSNPATVFLTQIVDGKMQKVNLCENCSKEKGVSDPTGFALTDFLLGLGASEAVEQTATEQQCPVCGFSQSDFKKTGRLGCSNCYETFFEGLDPLLKTMHKGTKHVGKVPARLFREIELSTQLKDLREGLERSVSAEDYEEAAKLRDQIRHLETTIEKVL